MLLAASEGWAVPATQVLAGLPGPDARPIALRVTPQAGRALRDGHPWVFDRAIRQQSRTARPGTLAVVFDRKGHFLAVGLWDPTSSLRLRILQHSTPATIDRDWYRQRFLAAAARRVSLAGTGTTGYRLAHGENDGLPGLVVDRYGDTLVLKLYSVAWVPHLPDLLAVLAEVQPAERYVLRLSRGVQALPDHLYGLRDGMVLGGPALDGPVLFLENHLRFEADPVHGHKTGFYLDQRDNRARVEALAVGRQVLNVFAYSGGFSVCAARGGAVAVASVDASRPALEAAGRNFALNRHLPSVAACAHELVQGDAFQVLAGLAQDGRRFDLVILDPPAFANKQSQVGRALAGYRRLTQLGLGVLSPGGILVQASCSSRVAAHDFFDAVHEAAREAGRGLEEIERTGHPPDHPVGFLQGSYLKCLFAVVA